MKGVLASTAWLGVVLGTTAALAEEPFGAEVWLASPQLCQEAKAAGSLRKVLDDGNLVLSAEGLSGADFRCHFVQVLKAPDVDAWVATALCRQSGAGDFPNMYSVSKGMDGRLTLVTVYDDEEPAVDPGAGDGSDAAPDETAPESTPDTPPVTGQPDGAQESGTAATPPAADAPSADSSADVTGVPPDDAASGDVYSRCEGVAAP